MPVENVIQIRIEGATGKGELEHIRVGGKLKQLTTVQWIENWEDGGHTYHRLLFWEGRWIRQWRDYCNPRFYNQELDASEEALLLEFEGKEISDLKERYGDKYEFFYEN